MSACAPRLNPFDWISVASWPSSSSVWNPALNFVGSYGLSSTSASALSMKRFCRRSYNRPPTAVSPMLRPGDQDHPPAKTGSLNPQIESVRLDQRRVLAQQQLGVEPSAELRRVVRLVEHERQRVEHEAILQAVVQPPHDRRVADAPPGVRVRSLGEAGQLEPGERGFEMVHRGGGRRGGGPPSPPVGPGRRGGPRPRGPPARD